MPRVNPVAVVDTVYRVLNRSNGRSNGETSVILRISVLKMTPQLFYLYRTPPHLPCSH